MSDSLLSSVDLDDVLVKFSIYGRYHALCAVWISLASIYNAIVSVNFVFVAEEVRYSCADNNDTLKISENSNVSNAQSTMAWCRSPEQCSRWIYEDPDSFVAEFQLACEDWKRTLVGTVRSFGCMVGLLIVGPLSDKFGRKFMVIITGVAGAVCGVTKSFVSFYWMYVFFEFVESALGDPYSPLYMIALEMVSANSRVQYTTISNIGFPLGGVIFPVMYWSLSYWRTFLRVLYAPALLFISAIYFIDESPRWHLSKGNTQAAVKIIEKAAKISKIEIEENLAQLSCKKDANLNFMRAILDTFKSRPLLKSLFACITWWTASVFVSYGLSMNSVLLDGNKYVNYALSSVVEFPSYIIMVYLMNKFHRKGPLIFSFVACAVVCACQPFIPSNLPWLSISIYMIGKLLSTMYFGITYIYTSELFPTCTRNSMHALCSSVGRIGGMAAPLTPLLMVYWSGLPTMLFGVASIIGALVTFLVPDTAEKPLPDTVIQAEALANTNTTGQLEEVGVNLRAREEWTKL